MGDSSSRDFKIAIVATADATAIDTVAQKLAGATEELKVWNDLVVAAGAAEDSPLAKQAKAAAAEVDKLTQSLQEDAVFLSGMTESWKEQAPVVDDLGSKIKAWAEQNRKLVESMPADDARVWAETNKGAFEGTAAAARKAGPDLDTVAKRLAAIQSESGAVHAGLGLLEGALAGTGWGILAVALGQAVYGLVQSREEMKKQELAKHAEEVKAFAAELQKLGTSAAGAFTADQTAKLDAYIESLKKLASGWEDSAAKAKVYYDYVDAKADAQASLDKSKNELERQNALKGVTDKDKQREINDTYDQKARDIDFTAKNNAIETKKKEAQEALDRAKRDAGGATERITDANQAAGDADRRAAMPGDVSSDQQRLLEKYRDALIRIQSGRGKDEDQDTVHNTAPNLPELRRRVQTGDVTYEDAKKSKDAEESTAGAQAEAQNKVARDEADKQRKLAADLEKERLKSEDEVKKRERELEVLNLQSQGNATGALAGDQQAQNKTATAAAAAAAAEAKKDNKNEQAGLKDKERALNVDQRQEEAAGKHDATAVQSGLKSLEKADPAHKAEYEKLAQQAKDNPTAEGLKKVADAMTAAAKTADNSILELLRTVHDKAQSEAQHLELSKQIAAQQAQLKQELEQLRTQVQNNAST